MENRDIQWVQSSDATARFMQGRQAEYLKVMRQEYLNDVYPFSPLKMPKHKKPIIGEY